MTAVLLSASCCCVCKFWDVVWVTPAVPKIKSDPLVGESLSPRFSRGPHQRTLGMFVLGRFFGCLARQRHGCEREGRGEGRVCSWVMDREVS